MIRVRQFRKALLAGALGFGGGAALFAQDPLVADPQHFKLEYEDEQVRVLRFTLPAGETSPMHDHLQRVTVILRASRVRVTEADGATHEDEFPAGTARHPAPARHMVANIGRGTYETVVTEFKWTSPLPQTDFERQELARIAAAARAAAATAASTSTPTPPPVTEPRRAQPVPVPKPAPPTAANTSPAGSATVPETPTRSLATILDKPRIVVAAIEGAKALRINGVDINYVEAGKGDPVIFVHGPVTDLRIWSLQLDAFAVRHHVVSYSRRYHYPNAATGKEKDYNFAQHTADLVEFIRALGLGKVHLIADSYGAVVAGTAALQHPELVRTLALLEPGYEALLPEMRQQGARYAREEILNEVRRTMVKKKSPESGLRQFVEWQRGPGGWDNLPPNDQQLRRDNMNALADQSMWPEAPAFACEDGPKLAVPVLVVVGEQSSPDSKEIARRVAACVPGAQTMTVPAAGKQAYRDNPATFNQKVMGFLASH